MEKDLYRKGYMDRKQEGKTSQKKVKIYVQGNQRG